MKITELERLDEIRRDAEIPVAVEGKNFNITVGQILDEAVPDTTISYEDMVDMTDSQAMKYALSLNQCRLTVTKSSGSMNYNVGVLDLVSDDNAHTVSQVFTTHYIDPQPDGTFQGHSFTNLYTYERHIGVLSSVVPKTWSKWEIYGNSEPIEVASEEEMARRIELGEYKDGQIYFLAEG